MGNATTLFYRMRFMGIRRKFKPYPDCADQHFPLTDGLIERAKPFYYQQLYARACAWNGSTDRSCLEVDTRP